MTGDRALSFRFQPLPKQPVATLFGHEEFALRPGDTSVLMFSGGLDSLAGALQRLEASHDHVCLVSHQSSSIQKRAQTALATALTRYYPGRTSHYRFPCTLLGAQRRREETQRTRAFLFCSIGFSLACALKQDRIYVCENGVTSLNFMRREDLGDARASRTTNPATLQALEGLFSQLAESQVIIENPLFWKTKADVLKLLGDGPHPDLIASAVSCTKPIRASGLASHCGTCLQCVDRRLAAYASGLESQDGPGNYSHDFVRHTPPKKEDITTLVDYLRQAREFAECGPDSLLATRLDEISTVVPALPGAPDEISAVESLAELLRRHGRQVRSAVKRVQAIHEEPFLRPEEGSLIALVASREHLREPVDRLVSSLQTILGAAVPRLFRS